MFARGGGGFRDAGASDRVFAFRCCLSRAGGRWEHFVGKSGVFLLEGVYICLFFDGEYDGVVICVVFCTER